MTQQTTAPAQPATRQSRWPQPNTPRPTPRHRIATDPHNIDGSGLMWVAPPDPRDVETSDCTCNDALCGSCMKAPGTKARNLTPGHGYAPTLRFLEAD